MNVSVEIMFLYFIGALILIEILRTIIGHYLVTFPKRPVMILVGFVLGAILKAYPRSKQMDVIRSICEEVLALDFVIEPLLIFKCTFSMDGHMFLRSWRQIFVLAIPGLVISACATGFIMKLVPLSEITWTICDAISFGALVSEIRPTEVMHTLKYLGQAKQLSMLLDGEGIIGDGTIIILLSLLAGIKHQLIETYYHVLMVFVVYMVGGLILGAICGKILIFVMKFIFNDIISMISLTVAAPCLTFYFANEVVLVSGVISVVVLGIMTGSKTRRLSAEVETFLFTFWGFIGYVINAMVCILAGIFVVALMTEETILYCCGVGFLTYIIALCSRILTYVLLMPIISRTGYGLNIKGAIVAIWSGIKGPIPVLLSMDPHFEDRETVMLLVCFLLILTVFINGLTIPILLNLLGISEMSILRKMNMNSCIKHVQTRRVRTIQAMKMDRFLVDANWKVVNEVTQVKHPYKKILWDVGEFDDEETYIGTRPLLCPDCKKDLAYEPSKNDLKEMLREARIRILRLRKMSYIRQFQNGTIGKDSVRILCQAIEVAIDTPNAIIKLEGLHKYFQKSSPFNSFCNKLLRICFDDEEYESQPPKGRWRRITYHTMHSRKFQCFIYLIILCNASCICLKWIYAYSNNPSTVYSLIASNTFFFLMFLMEFICNVFAFSAAEYFGNSSRSHFSSVVKISAFLMLSIQFSDLVLEYVVLFSPNKRITLIHVSLGLKIVQLLRMVRLIGLCRVWYPNVLQYLNSRVDAQLAFAYDIGKGYVMAEEEVEGMLPQMIDHKTVREKCQANIEADRLAITKQLGIIQKDRPWIAVTVKTRQAVRSTLNNMRATVNDLKALGWLDEFEHEKLSQSIEERVKYASTKLSSVEPLSAREMLMEVSWMSDGPTYQYLYSNVMTKIFDPGDVICVDGDETDGIYIIVTGLLKLTYVPKMHTLHRLESCGILPVVDYISSTNFEQRIEEYLVTGNSIGEISVLTGRPYDCTIIAETSSQTYFLSTEVLRKAFTLNQDPIKGLEAKMWKTISLKLCAAILIDTPAYQLHGFEKIYMQLQRGFVPNLSKYTQLEILDTVEDLILIEGIVFDSTTATYYTAPCYIPRTVNTIHFQKTELCNIAIEIDTKIMIIPANDLQDIKLQENENENPKIVSNIISKCLLHYVRDKFSQSNLRRQSTNFNALSKKRQLSYSVTQDTATKMSVSNAYATRDETLTMDFILGANRNDVSTSNPSKRNNVNGKSSTSIQK